MGRCDDVKLNAVPPHVRVRASCTKNHTEAVIRLRDDLATELRAFRPSAWKPEDRCLRVPWMRDMQADFVRAGIARNDGLGRRADFHALRHTFGTRMAAAGVPLRTIQQWMGHADSKTTQVYAHYQPSEHEVEIVERAFSKT